MHVFASDVRCVHNDFFKKWQCRMVMHRWFRNIWPMERRKRHRSPWIDLSIPFPSNECILDRRSDAPVMLACFCCSYHNILVACSLSVVMLDVVSPNRQETSASSLKKSVCLLPCQTEIVFRRLARVSHRISICMYTSCYFSSIDVYIYVCVCVCRVSISNYS